MARKLTLEAEEWYVLCNWLRERENRLMYALRSKSREWRFVHDLRRDIEDQTRSARAGGASTEGESGGVSREGDGDGRDGDADETAGEPRTVVLSDRQASYLASFLRRRARKLRFVPWRSRERRDVRHLRDHLLAAAEPASRPVSKE